MIAWVNFAALLVASILFLLFYVRSASPAGREKIIGPRAYQLCFYDRLAAAGLEFVITANYILYYFFPLPAPLPESFPWAWGAWAGVRRSGSTVWVWAACWAGASCCSTTPAANLASRARRF